MPDRIIVSNESFETYQASPHINASTLKHFLKDFGARWEAKPETVLSFDLHDPLRFGTFAHMALLEVDEFNERTKTCVLRDNYNGRKKEDREYRDTLFEKHKGMILHFEEYKTILGMMNALDASTDNDVEYIINSIIAGKCQTEISVYDKMAEVNAKARYDLLFDSGVIVDYKTCASANPEDFVKSAINLDYDLSAAWYLDLMNQGDEEYEAFMFLAQEKKPPYLYNLISFGTDSPFIVNGRVKYNKALNKYNRYQKGFKGYDGNAIAGDTCLPPWYVKQY